MQSTDVCIVGGGPAGASLAHFLSKQNIDFVLIDKASFPRDKVCGDGITVDVLNVLKRIDPQLLDDFASQPGMLPSWGFCFTSSNGRELRYDFKDDGFSYAPFYTSRRLDLDNFLIRKLPDTVGELLTETKVTGIKRLDKGFEVGYKNREGENHLGCKIIVGAEGEKPVVTKNLNEPHFREKRHLIAALRVYYKNVKGFNKGQHLEFFFDKKLLPGYFWVFPLSDNEANVGLGMLSSEIASQKYNLKKLFKEVMESNPRISEMFVEAEPLESPQGWGLPLVTPKRRIAGHGYALIGDAAGMIEPFTGKGIGPGMMSARICSEHIEKALTSKNYDMMPYHEHMYRYYKNEIRTGYSLQRSLKYPPMLNAVIRMANLPWAKKWSHEKMRREWHKWM